MALPAIPPESENPDFLGNPDNIIPERSLDSIKSHFEGQDMPGFQQYGYVTLSDVAALYEESQNDEEILGEWLAAWQPTAGRVAHTGMDIDTAEEIRKLYNSIVPGGLLLPGGWPNQEAQQFRAVLSQTPDAPVGQSLLAIRMMEPVAIEGMKEKFPPLMLPVVASTFVARSAKRHSGGQGGLPPVDWLPVVLVGGLIAGTVLLLTRGSRRRRPAQSAQPIIIKS